MRAIEYLFYAFEDIVGRIDIIIVKASQETDVLNLRQDVIVNTVPGIDNIAVCKM